MKGLLQANSSVKNAMLFNVLSFFSDKLLTEGNTVATLDELYNEDGEAIQVAPHAEMVVRWKTDLDVAPGAYLRVKKEPRSE